MSAVSRIRIDGLLPWRMARGTDPFSPCQTLAATIPTAAAWNAAAIALPCAADVRAQEAHQGHHHQGDAADGGGDLGGGGQPAGNVAQPAGDIVGQFRAARRAAPV